MVLKNAPINHEADNLHDALTIPKNQRERCRERIFFATMANGLQALELYAEEPDECPKEMCTKTGDLQRTLKLINDPLEYEYTLLTFMKLQNLAQESMHKWKAMNDTSMSKSQRAKLEIMMNLHELAVRHGAEEGGDNDNSEFLISPNSLLKRVDLVKSSHYNWETYFNMIKAKNFYYLVDENESKAGSDFDIDDMLRNVFGKDTDE